jgi:hypothetical protein
VLVRSLHAAAAGLRLRVTSNSGEMNPGYIFPQQLHYRPSTVSASLPNMSSMRASVPRYFHTKRLVLELFDHSIPEHYECLLGSMNSPTAHARMGDFRVRTPAEFDALNDATRLTGAYCQEWYLISISTTSYESVMKMVL